jgi:hypothetical protein
MKHNNVFMVSVFVLMVLVGLASIVGMACTPDARQRSLDAGRCKVSVVLREAPSARELTIDDLREVASRLKACRSPE